MTVSIASNQVSSVPVTQSVVCYTSYAASFLADNASRVHVLAIFPMRERRCQQGRRQHTRWKDTILPSKG